MAKAGPAAASRTGELRGEGRGPLRRGRRDADADDVPLRQGHHLDSGENQTGDCWFGDGKLYLTMPGEEGAMELDLNDDGSLQGSFGELKKKAK